MMPVHQCARFSQDPWLPHKKALKQIVCYLHSTPDKSIIMHPQTAKGLECYVDANFAGGFMPNSASDATSCLSCTRFFINFANCPIVWASKLQPIIALSTIKAKYIALLTV